MTPPSHTQPPRNARTPDPKFYKWDDKLLKGDDLEFINFFNWALPYMKIHKGNETKFIDECAAIGKCVLLALSRLGLPTQAINPPLPTPHLNPPTPTHPPTHRRKVGQVHGPLRPAPRHARRHDGRHARRLRLHLRPRQRRQGTHAFLCSFLAGWVGGEYVVGYMGLVYEFSKWHMSLTFIHHPSPRPPPPQHTHPCMCVAVCRHGQAGGPQLRRPRLRAPR